MYEMSKDFPENLTTQISRITDKKTKKILDGQLQSCFLIRCRVGNLYHMEAGAKLTMLHNLVNGVVFLMVNVKA